MRAMVAGLLIAILTLGIGVAGAQTKQAGNATDVVNPHSPRNGHPYRHGVVPTREAHAKMKAWVAANRNLTRQSEKSGKSHGAGGPTAVTGDETLSYNGGVDGIGVTSGPPKVYLVFWGTQWGTAGTDAGANMTFTGDPTSAAPYIQQWIKGLGTNDELWSGVMTQYCDGPSVAAGATSCPASAPHVGYPHGGVLAGVWYDNSAQAPWAATGHDIAAEAVKAAGHFGNTTQASNRYAQYVIVSPTGTQPDGFNTPEGGFCAWHDFNGDTTLTGGAATSVYGDIAFTNMPYVTDAGMSCGAYFVNSELDGFSLVGGHEYAETITDQNPAGGWINNTGSAYNGQENADECSWISFGQGAAELVAFSTGSFAMQSTWSNDTNRCDISHPIVTGSGGAPVADFTFSASGLTVSFTDRSTDSGGTIGSHAWTFGDGGTSTATNPSHTFAAAGTYNVTEKVTDSGNGATSTKTASVTVSALGGTPIASFTYTASGTTVAFKDTSTDSGGTIGAHLWHFGDGTTSTATNPSHTYAAAGTYSVSETVTDSVNGRSSTKTSAVTVSSTSIQLLGNTGFETGTAYPWILTDRVLCSNATCSGETARAGNWFAWLNGYGHTYTDSATQAVSIPAGKTSATLAFYMHIDTMEFSRSIAYDTLQVQVLNSAGTVLKTLATYSNVNAASGYSRVTLNMNACIGQSVKIRFLGTEDASLATSFLIDDVTLTAQ
jgi:serine protease